MSRTSSPASKQAWESRFRQRGARMVGVRLSPAAAMALERIRETHGCSDRDAIEGLLLGTIGHNPVIQAMLTHGLSRDEAVEFVRGCA